MAFPNSQTITVGSETIALERVFTGSTTGKFQSGNGETYIEVTPAVSKDGRQHRVARLHQRKTTSDPLVGSVNIRVNDFMSFNINRPQDGYSDADVLAQAKAFITWLTASTDANLKKLIAGEN